MNKFQSVSSIEFLYGNGKTRVNVTQLAQDAFLKSNRLEILQSASFNLIFGDVLPNQAKTLRICFLDDNTSIELSETRQRDYVAYFGLTACNLSKTIVQYWPSKVSNSTEFKALRQFGYELYSFETALILLQRNFPKTIANAFKKCKVYEMQRDLFCYCYLYLCGGFFIDMDITCSTTILENIANSNVVETVLFENKDKCISSEFMASRPFNRLFRKAIDTCVANIMNETFPDIQSTTGSVMLTLQCKAIFGENYSEDRNITLLRKTANDCPIVKFGNAVFENQISTYNYFDLRSMLAVDNIFVLNLAKRSDRLEECRNEFKNLLVEKTQWERFEAYLGADQSVQSKFSKEFKQFCDKQPVKVTTFGAFGCLLSHYHMIKIAKERGYKRLLIVEDDFAATSRFSDQQLLKKIGALDFDMFYFSMTMVFPPQPTDDPDIFRVGRAVSTGAYIINCSLFDFIIENCFEYAKEIDVFYADVIQQKFKVLCTEKSLILQRESFSDIEQRNVNYFINELNF